MSHIAALYRRIAQCQRTLAAGCGPWYHQERSAKILRWLADTPHSRQMEKLTHFDDLLNYCLDNRGTLGKRDVIASLSYMRTLKHFSLSSTKLAEYCDFVCSNLALFRGSVHLLVHRFAIIGYSPALLRIYEGHLRERLEALDDKQLCLICWSYAKSNVYIQELFERVAATYLYREGPGSLTDVSLLLWSFARIERRVPHEIAELRARVFGAVEAIARALREPDAPLDDTAARYLDSERMFYCNVSHDICMAARALAALVPRDKESVQRLVELQLEIARLGRLALSAQGITSLWESLCLSGVSDAGVVADLCEASRYLRLDHSFNSNMVTSIVRSVHALSVRDARIVYQLVHWLEKRAVQMHAPQMYTAICLLDAMGVYHERAWKQLGVIVQKKAIDLELSEIRHLYNIFKRNGKGNDRIFGILEHFMSCKEDIERYGPR